MYVSAGGKGRAVVHAWELISVSVLRGELLGKRPLGPSDVVKLKKKMPRQLRVQQGVCQCLSHVINSTHE